MRYPVMFAVGLTLILMLFLYPVPPSEGGFVAGVASALVALGWGKRGGMAR